MIERECILCSKSSIQQTTAKEKHVPRHQHVVGFVECLNCNRLSCRECINGWLGRIVNCKEVSKSAKKNDVTINTLHRMADIVNNPPYERTIDYGICCCFKQSIPKGASMSTIKIPTPPTPKEIISIINDSSVADRKDYNDEEYVNNEYDGDDDDECIETYHDKGMTRIEAISSLRRTINRIGCAYDKNNINNLSLYHSTPTEYTAVDKMKPIKPRQILKYIQQQRKRKQQKRIPSNIYEGMLYLGSFGLCILAQASAYMSVDHMALAESNYDNTVGVGHCVPNKKSADAAHEYAMRNDIKRKSIGGKRERIEMKVPSPEDANKYRQVVVELIEIEQICSEEDAKQSIGKGCNEFTPEHLTSLNTFSTDDVSDGVDYVAVIGKLNKESTPNQYKLLILRPMNMLTNLLYTNEQRLDLNKKVYEILRPKAGRGGSELKREGGSSGNISADTDLDMLAVQHLFKGLVPRHLYAVGIIRDAEKQRYHLLYTKVNPEEGTNPYALTFYTPARDGGAFDMPPVCATLLPLGDLTYNKMMAILLWNEMNKILISRGRRAVAAGPTSCEMKKILISRQVYADSQPEVAMFNMITSFNGMNHFSMVAYTVGYHCDHYYGIDDEYIENKANLMFKMQNHIGRGGSIAGNMYVYALLDWGTAEAKARAAAKRRAKKKGLRSAARKRSRKN